jgi:hypothetical protein
MKQAKATGIRVAFFVFGNALWVEILLPKSYPGLN